MMQTIMNLNFKKTKYLEDFSLRIYLSTILDIVRVGVYLSFRNGFGLWRQPNIKLISIWLINGCSDSVMLFFVQKRSVWMYLCVYVRSEAHEMKMKDILPFSTGTMVCYTLDSEYVFTEIS